ncbi:MAG: SH3 domain-containing protein [Saccharothrix sp.]|nr:SH3 domain-containing protein [Saccharothrix sp.]
MPALFSAIIAFVAVGLLPATAAAAPADSLRADAPACYVTPKKGVSAVNVRLRANPTSTKLGTIQSGQKAPASCDATKGGEYTACGGTSQWWIQVTWNDRTGYVAHLCVDWITT